MNLDSHFPAAEFGGGVFGLSSTVPVASRASRFPSAIPQARRVCLTISLQAIPARTWPPSASTHPGFTVELRYDFRLADRLL